MPHVGWSRNANIHEVNIPFAPHLPGGKAQTLAAWDSRIDAPLSAAAR
jgi:hypothetical protein